MCGDRNRSFTVPGLCWALLTFLISYRDCQYSGREFLSSAIREAQSSRHDGGSFERPPPTLKTFIPWCRDSIGGFRRYRNWPHDTKRRYRLSRHACNHFHTKSFLMRFIHYRRLSDIYPPFLVINLRHQDLYTFIITQRHFLLQYANSNYSNI